MTGTMCDLTFYMMEGENYVRKKSSLTREQVLESPAFKKTRFYAGLMAQASGIGSVIYNALPHHWRQGWMYRAFAGEAMQMLKEGRMVEETTRLLWERYVEAINNRGEDLGGRLQDAVVSVAKPPRGRRKKTDPRVERLKPYSDLLAKASKMASLVYNSLPRENRKIAITSLAGFPFVSTSLISHPSSHISHRTIYQACVAEAMKVLRTKEKESGSQVEVTAPIHTDANAIVQILEELGEDLAQPSGLRVHTVPSIRGSIKLSTKPNKSQAKNRFFYIPPVDLPLVG